jgi:photosystem II stability/assembly factor-like uncharacterized protein
MKKCSYYFFFSLLFLYTLNLAQSSNWELQSPPFTSANLTDVLTFGDNNILSFGDGGKIIKSNDGGNSWSSVTTPISDKINNAFFIDQNTGWIVAASRIFKTTDGGSTWSEQNDGTSATLYGIDFINATTGWIVGTSRTILKTTDGGLNWISQIASQSLVFLYDVDFVNQNFGFAVGWGSEGQVYKTTDGGNNWTPVSLTGTWLTKVHFRDQLNGYAVGCHSNYISVTSDPFMGTSINVSSPKLKVWKTTNGGVDWTSTYWELSGYLRGINFKDNNNGIFVGDGGAIIKTIDGAQSFSFITNPAIPQITYNDIAYTNSSHILVAGNFGYILKSSDNGVTWIVKNGNGTTNSINSCFFLNQQTAYACCNNGVVLKTTNGGSVWLAQTAGGTQYDDWYSIYFTDEQHGWVVGETGKMRYTTNGGTTWTNKYTSNSWTINGLCFKDQNTGFAVGEHGTLLKTNDGGNNWSKITLSTTNTLYGIQFIDNNGWISGTGIVIKTTDGGLNWTVIQLSEYQNTFFYSVCFINSDLGWLCGSNGSLLKTTDGGQTWVKYFSGTTNDLRKVYFFDQYIGWVTGVNGIVLKTVDGGNKWGEIRTGINYPTSQFSSYWEGFKTVKFVDPSNGWLMGSNGYIIRTTTGGGQIILSPQLQLPADKSKDIPISTALTWENINGALSYELQVSNFFDFRYANTYELTQNSHTLTGLDNNKLYYWKVRTNYGSEKSSWSQVFSFTTLPQNINAPQTPNINYPVETEDLYPVSLKFQWAPVSQAIDYHLQIATDWNFQSVIYNKTNITETWIDITNLDYLTTYYYRIRAHNTYGYSGYSNPGNMITESRNWHAFRFDNWDYIKDLYFINKDIGFIVNSYFIRKTTDGGISWRRVEPYLSGYKQCNDILFTDQMNGWVVCEGGRILNTTDGGETWSEQTSGITNSIINLFFINSSEGWSVSPYHELLKTTDGGKNWIKYTIPGSGSIYSLHFFDNQKGIAFGYKAIYRTTDGGVTWNSTDSELTLYKSFFLSSTVGWVVGTNGTICKTSNGGETWVSQQSGVAVELNDIYFFDQNMGIVVGNSATILKTTDGGLSWSQDISGANQRRNFYSLQFISSNVGWILGWRVLLSTNNAGGFTSVDDEDNNSFYIPNDFVLYNNYPNPFNPATVISFSIPRSLFVEITVYDILGREVKNLIREFRNGGKYFIEYDASGLNSGIYFYKLKAGDFVQTKKMILLK